MSQTLTLLGSRLPKDHIEWIDGLRGLAAVFVILNHVALAVFPDIVLPTSEDTLKSIWQRPFINLFFTGFPWIGLFLVLSSWVNAIKPLKLMNSGQHEEAVLSLSSSAFRRTFRLTLPVTIATAISWAMAQIGAYRLAEISDNKWLQSTTPHQSSTVLEALWRFLNSIYTTWVEADNYYDRNMWFMKWLLAGSFTLYLTLLVVARLQPSQRRLFFLGLFLWSWKRGDDIVGMPTFGGIFLADLSLTEDLIIFAKSKCPVRPVSAIVLFLSGWYFMSNPYFDPSWNVYYSMISEDMRFIFSETSKVVTFPTLAGIFSALFAIIISPRLQAFFANPVLLSLGTISFPMFLLHGPLLRSFMLWVAYAFDKSAYLSYMDDDGTIVEMVHLLAKPSYLRLMIAIPFFFGITIACSVLWMESVDPWCNSFIESIENTCVDGYERIELPIDEKISQIIYNQEKIDDAVNLV